MVSPVLLSFRALQGLLELVGASRVGKKYITFNKECIGVRIGRRSMEGLRRSLEGVSVSIDLVKTSRSFSLNIERTPKRSNITVKVLHTRGNSPVRPTT